MNHEHNSQTFYPIHTRVSQHCPQLNVQKIWPVQLFGSLRNLQARKVPCWWVLPC